MERQFNACQTPRSMYLSILNSFRVIRCLIQCVSPKIAIFTARCYASTVYAIMQCPSVRLSFRLSRSWITSKRINISSKFFQHRVATPFCFFPYQTGCRYSDGNPPNGDVECKGGMIKCRFFSQISHCIWETVILRWAHAARQFLSIEFSFHPYNI